VQEAGSVAGDGVQESSVQECSAPVVEDEVQAVVAARDPMQLGEDNSSEEVGDSAPPIDTPHLP
jgi:hypothetical protein